MTNRVKESKDKGAAQFEPSAIVLLLFYILITVAGHADTDLIRPDTQISLQAAAEKVSLPSGWLFTPFLGLKLSVFWFYTLAPLLVLGLHVELLRRRPAASEPWARVLRLAGNLLAPAALFLLLWKFVPYGLARPPDVSGISAGAALSYFLAAVLLVDAALLLYAGLEPIGDPNTEAFGRSEGLRRIGLAFLALQQAGLLWLLALGLATLARRR